MPQNCSSMLAQGSAALTTIQGIEVGFFDHIPAQAPSPPRSFRARWDTTSPGWSAGCSSPSRSATCQKTGNGYSLTPKGSLLPQKTPVPDLLGLHHMVGYFTKAVQYSQDSYKKGTGLDSITELKIGRDYIPRVASQLSSASAEFFKRSGVSTGIPFSTSAAETVPSCGRRSRPARA